MLSELSHLLLNLVRSFAQFIDAKALKEVGVKPIGRDISGLPLVCQTNPAINDCVACSVTFAKQYQEKQTEGAMALSANWLATQSGTTQAGVQPSKVLSVAKEVGIASQDAANLGNESACLSSAMSHKVTDANRIWLPSPVNLYKHLLEGLVMVGTDDYANVGPHMMVAYDVSEGGQTLMCVNWWDDNVQQLAEIPLTSVNFAVSFPSL